MSADDQIEELKAIIEEDRRLAEEKKEQRRMKMREWSRKSKAKMKDDPERYKRTRETTNIWRKATKATTSHMRRKRERLAGRPKPETCEICGRGGEIVFEHDHMTGKFRGWTCGRCNVALGMVDHSIVLLEKLIIYLKAHDVQTE